MEINTSIYIPRKAAKTRLCRTIFPRSRTIRITFYFMIVFVISIIMIHVQYNVSSSVLPVSFFKVNQVKSRIDTFDKCAELRSDTHGILFNLNKKTVIELPNEVEYWCKMLEICEQEKQSARNDGISELCPCLPAGLVGNVALDANELMYQTKWNTLTSKLDNINHGGHWKPTHCVARRHVAVIIPYRDRERHLRAFLAHMHPILQRQLVEYRIFVIEQNLPHIFNKASLMNIGYLEAKKVFDFDCVLFHDVDTLIDRDDNMVICHEFPVHFAAYSDRMEYRFFPSLFGSGILLRNDTFTEINGFSNNFYGWGGEDENLRDRLLGRRKGIYHPPLSIGRCTLLKHERDILFNTSALHKPMPSVMRTSRIYKFDGLSSVNYDIIDQTDTPLYTWILANHKEPVYKISPAAFMPSFIREYGGFDQKSALNSIFADHTPFNISKGRCKNPVHILATTQLPLSRVTCRYKCETLGETCQGFEYHFNQDDISYCVLHKEACMKVVEQKDTEIHVKL